LEISWAAGVIKTSDYLSIFHSLCHLIEYFFHRMLQGYEKILGDQLRNEPALFVPDALSILKNFIKHKAAYPGVYSKQTLRVLILVNCFHLLFPSLRVWSNT